MKDKEDRLIYLKNEAEFQDKKTHRGAPLKTAKYYSDAATAYLLQYRSKLLGNLTKKSVLDLGAGEGLDSLDALRNGADVTAVDISPASIACLKTVAAELGLEDHLTAVVIDAHNLLIPDESFDIVMGNGKLHHLPNPERVLSEIYRVLKPGGYAVFREP